MWFTRFHVKIAIHVIYGQNIETSNMQSEEHVKNATDKYASPLIFQHTARENHNMDWNNIL